MTYGDGLCDVNLNELVKFHLKHKKIASSGAWINNNEFMLSTYLFETPVRMDYKFIFEGKILKIESVANNYLGKSNQPNFLRSVEND